MTGKKKGLKKFEDCRHRQGFWSVSYATLILKCRHCKIEIKMHVPRELDAAGKRLAAAQLTLPAPRV